jgi:hypothetical protein
MEQQEKGYRSLGGKYVCKNCIGNEFIKNYIKEHCQESYCDYCERESDELIAADMDDVLDFILDGINSEWDHPIRCMTYDEEWIGFTKDSYDLIRFELADELNINNEQLIEDIISAFIDNEWCERNPYSERDFERDYYNWEQFVNLVKYRVRYVFYRSQDYNQEFTDYESIEPSKILDRIGSITNTLGLIKPLPVNTIFFRVRVHKKNERFLTVEELGPPPNDKTKSNRMSPAGIVMFYGASDKKTALLETCNNSKKRVYATIAMFKTLRELNVVNLTNIPNIPSLFDKEQNYLRNAIIFLQSFLDDITKPVVHDGMEHIDYVPTQIVTEYFRYIFSTTFGIQVNGIIYPSSRNTRGQASVLFLDNSKCTQDNRQESNDDEKWLCLLTKSIETLKVHI